MGGSLRRLKKNRTKVSVLRLRIGGAQAASPIAFERHSRQIAHTGVHPEVRLRKGQANDFVQVRVGLVKHTKKLKARTPTLLSSKCPDVQKKLGTGCSWRTERTTNKNYEDNKFLNEPNDPRRIHAEGALLGMLLPRPAQRSNMETRRFMCALGALGCSQLAR
jgi:hypothetical protein